MCFRIFFMLVFISIQCFSLVPFLQKDVHIPPSSNTSHSIRFGTTRTLDNGSLKSSLLEQLKKAFEIEAFIETGTYLADTTIKAAQIFDEVHTIELSLELCLKASQRLKPWNHVIVHLGDSKEILPNLLPTVHRRILFYLDGHYSGHVTARGSQDTPILNELKAIELAKKDDSIILIDDLRLFQSSLFLEKSKALNLGLDTYPDLEEIVRAILKINSDYQICFLGDALLAFPKNQRVCVSPITRSCALHRLENLCTDLSEEDLKEADLVISKATSDEKEEIEIYYRSYSPFELEYGYRSYSCLWQALILREEGDEKQAQSLLKKAASKSMPNWRVNQCIH